MLERLHTLIGVPHVEWNLDFPNRTQKATCYLLDYSKVVESLAMFGILAGFDI